MSEDRANFDNHELAAFVEATLRAISQGISSASARVKQDARDDELAFHQFASPKAVGFDIAVSVRRQNEKGGALKLEVFSLGGSVDGKSASQSETVSRISFEIPWTLGRTPKGRVEEGKRKRETLDRFARLSG
jgi:hypothetical protein